jgi:cell wall assembly regulator SMI1
MFVAIAENNLKAVKQMTEEGFPHESLWYHGRTSLHLAIEERKKKIFEYLLEAGVDPNVRDGQFERTPLHLAASEGYADFVKLLLEHGADCTIKDGNGLSVLFQAVFGGHLEATGVLVEAGLDVHDVPERHGTLLGVAVSRSRDEKLTEYLIQQGCSPNQFPEGSPPLGAAIQQFVICKQYPKLRGFSQFPHPPNVEVLLSHGADPNYLFPEDTDDAMRGRTIIEYAREGKISPKIIKMLESAASTPSAAVTERRCKRGKAAKSVTGGDAVADLANQGVAALWKQLRKTLARKAPDVRKSLRRGATEEHIAALQSDLNAQLPAEFVEALQMHNGQTPGAPCLIPSEFTSHEYELLAVDDILRERKVWAELLRAGEFRGQNALGDTGVRSKWYSTDWIPFASSGAGDFLCVDTNPTKKGTVGQIVSLDHESATRRLIAPSTSVFLARLNEYWAEVD